MLILKKIPERKVEEGQYYVGLSLYIDVCDPLQYHNKFGYYCDKGHLKHIVIESLNVFKDDIGEERFNEIKDMLFKV